MGVRIETLRDAQVAAHLSGLARLRIDVFREWPYLYDGDLEYEAGYLRAFASAPHAVIIGAFDGAELVGAATAAPLEAQAAYIVAPFRAASLDMARYFYFGESVLRREYRGTGLGVAFFEAREAAARDGPGVAECVFCAVMRDPHDARRPQGHVGLDAFWMRRGYRLWPGMTCEIAWREMDAAAETPHRMQFWRKDTRR